MGFLCVAFVLYMEGMGTCRCWMRSEWTPTGRERAPKHRPVVQLGNKLHQTAKSMVHGMPISIAHTASSKPKNTLQTKYHWKLEIGSCSRHVIYAPVHEREIVLANEVCAHLLITNNKTKLVSWQIRGNVASSICDIYCRCLFVCLTFIPLHLGP